ncbi:MAG: hypothetical protein VYB54_02435 [Pseudomonadota bacterium]|nr:hypothetical protein [Pseudomonadota bacterium]
MPLLRPVALMLLLGTAAPVAMAASDGSLSSSSSQGSASITATIVPLVQISGLDDLDLGEVGGTDVSASDGLCIYSNAGRYRITASGNGGDGGFQLTGRDQGGALPYQVTWQRRDGAATALQAGAAMTVQTGGVVGADCAGGGANAGIRVDLSAQAAAGLPADSYAGVLNLVVAPD